MEVRTGGLVPVLLADLAPAIVFLLVPDSTVRAPGTVDWTGALAISVGLGSLLWVLGGANGRPLAMTLGLLAGSLGVLAVWARIDLEQPALDHRRWDRVSQLDNTGRGLKMQSRPENIEESTDYRQYSRRHDKTFHAGGRTG
ncbi:hypothetical protein [Kutzneria kofuensis]|uniref:Uncharacterized protein n=1 Tax=Kutzneria kofuensis TaxID=103725 RepID=A0A7W9KF02_9PSEU|nr:hypothetical protein [Kutzneria kofuensis]MBB5891373.1 hypothetical protein [Kutzneria kofuensis]